MTNSETGDLRWNYEPSEGHWDESDTFIYTWCYFNPGYSNVPTSGTSAWDYAESSVQTNWWDPAPDVLQYYFLIPLLMLYLPQELQVLPKRIIPFPK